MKSGRCRRLLLVVMAVQVLCLFPDCRNPFFPPTGTPDITPPLRSTPMGVIKQLIQAYESKDYYLYEDLFPKSDSFQFYVSPSFVTTQKLYITSEPRDTLLFYIGKYPHYYYWTQSTEFSKHRDMFAKAELIEFEKQPYVNQGDFRYVVKNGETTNVEMLMTGGQIKMKIKMPAFIEEYLIDIAKQVFFLERDASGLWVIRKWYDFGG